MNIKDTKQTLRKTLLPLRLQLAEEERARAANAAAAMFLGSVAVMPGAVVAGYWPVRGEMNVLPLLRELARRGCRTALPCMEVVDAPLVFRLWRDGAPVRDGLYGIQEPDPARCMPVTPDIVLVPLLGFDARCHRLGYGAGFYDRTLAAWRGVHNFLAVGMAYDMQKLDEVPAEPYDVHMDMIVTEKQVYMHEGRTA